MTPDDAMLDEADAHAAIDAGQLEAKMGIIDQAWRVDIHQLGCIWIRCDLPDGQCNVPVTKIGANHPHPESVEIANEIVNSHNAMLLARQTK